ncbi:MAG TPA: DUF3106 domain-containing protein [Edaphobacter sp.]|nr:DUF3106 domain-containing protein [Edaphobacter sp.]
MIAPAKIRRTFYTVLAAMLFATTVPAFAGPRRGGGARAMFAPPSMRGQSPPRMNQGHMGRPQKQEHLGQWMNRHSNLSPAQQQQALENEPGFRRLPPETQQQLRDRLKQLNNMPPEQRQRLIERNEAMERLTPPQRQQVRSAMRQFRDLPDDRRRMVAHAFRDLREMPVPQRQSVLNSDRFRSQFSDQERSTLSSLLKIEPYLPVHPSNQAPQTGK